MPYTNEDEIWEQEMNKTHFTGFPLDVIEEGMKVLADAVGSGSGEDMVLNGTSEGIQKGMKDPRPFVIQNHGSLKEICRVWNSE